MGAGLLLASHLRQSHRSAPPDADARRFDFYGAIMASADRPDLAEILMPRIRLWSRDLSSRHPIQIAEVRAAVRSVAKCSPAFGMTLLRTWCDGWACSMRRGLGSLPCPACGRRDGDRLRHLIRCPALWRAVCGPTGLPPPRCVRNALGIGPAPQAPGKSRGRRQRPQCHIFALALACDAYHQLARGASGGAASEETRRRRLARAARHAVRRLWAL